VTATRPFLIAAGAALITAIAGGAMTRIDSWYRGLEKSALNPPDWAFAPAWTIIYALAALSAVTAWRDATHQRERSLLVILFFINSVLNIAWSAVFFTLRRPDWALAEVATLWISVAMIAAFLARFSRTGSLLMLPYLAWVTYAAYLNYKVVELNGPFG